jgi:amino acid permease
MKTFAALAVLIGTIIGAGILGMPYVIMKSGFPIGLVHIILIGSMMAALMLYLGEIVLRTKKIHQLPGYAGRYLGEKGKRLMFLSLCIGIFSAVLAYIIAEGRSLSYMIFNSPVYEFQMGLLFWLALSAITYFGIKAMAKGEIVGVTFVFIMIISLAVYFTNKINVNNLKYIFPNNFFTPFGVVLFAFLAFSVIPEVKRVLGEQKKSMKGVIIGAYAIAAIIYIIFTAIVIGFKGDATPELATIALGKPFILFGMITMFTAYLALTIAMIDIIHLDFNKKRKTAWLITIFIPFAAFVILSLAKAAAFTKVLGVGGAISGAITATLILSMITKAKKHGDAKPAYSMPYSRILSWILIAIFVIGALTEILELLI